ncbi:MAG: dihydrolipoyl dehydrogenase family protein, partial [Candidatus Woesearchaeota archaeon]
VITQLFTGLHESLKNSLVTIKHGFAKIQTSHEVIIEETNETVKGKFIIISVGSRTYIPKSYADAHTKTKVITHESILDLSKIPQKLAIIGGGYIGCEWAHIMEYYGSNVTIVEKADTILEGQDPDAVREIKRAYEKRKITILTNTSEIDVTKYDALMIATGRIPNIENIGLNTIGVEYTSEGIEVNEYCKTNVPNVYAIGDCIDRPYRLAHTAEHEGIVAVENALQLSKRTINYENIPSILFTAPQIMSVGKKEHILEQGTFKKGRAWLKGNARALCENKTDGFVKILTKKDGKIIGAVSVGKIDLHEVSVAIEASMNVEQYKSIVRFHPSLNESIITALENLR